MQCFESLSWEQIFGDFRYLQGKVCEGIFCHLRISESFSKFSYPFSHYYSEYFFRFLVSLKDIFDHGFCTRAGPYLECRFQPFLRSPLSKFYQKFKSVSWTLDEVLVSRSKESSHHLNLLYLTLLSCQVKFYWLFTLF